MGKIYKTGLILVLFMLLAAIRFYEESLFYDPLLAYFKSGYLDAEQLPPIDMTKMAVAITFRFWLNTAISLLVLFIAFREVAVLKFALLFYGVGFVLLLAAYIYIIHKYDPAHYIRLFYIRRFLIQPIFIILLLPAFYYQKQLKK